MSHGPSHSILVAIDGSAHANRAAEYLARNAPALAIREVVVLNVQLPGSRHLHTVGWSEASIAVAEMGTQASAVACRLLASASVPYRSITVQGDPANAIVQAADTELVEEIVIGSRGLSQLAGLTLGSVTYKVIHHTRLPVTVVVNLPAPAEAPGEAPRPHRVLLAVDGSKHALAAVDYVCDLRHAGARLEIELLHVPLPIPAAAGRGYASEEIVDLHNLEEGRLALRAATEKLQAAGEAFTTHIVPGDTVEKIVQLAEQRSCARIVMGTRGLGAMAGLFLGSVAYKIIHLATVPVTLVR